MKELKVICRANALARRVRALGRQISRDFRAQTLDVVAVLDNAFVFAADLVRAINIPVRTHFIRTETQDVTDPNTGKERTEIFYTPEISAAGKNILLVEGVLQSGITTDFLLRRIGLHQPRAVKTAVCVDKPALRKVFLEPDYYAVRLASKDMVVGYGLAWDGFGGNLPYLGTLGSQATRRLARARPARGRRKKRRK